MADSLTLQTTLPLAAARTPTPLAVPPANTAARAASPYSPDRISWSFATLKGQVAALQSDVNAAGPKAFGDAGLIARFNSAATTLAPNINTLLRSGNAASRSPYLPEVRDMANVLVTLRLILSTPPDTLVIPPTDRFVIRLPAAPLPLPIPQFGG